jgi:hypothetical protein
MPWYRAAVPADVDVGDGNFPSIVATSMMELVINRFVSVDVVEEKLIFDAATSAQATLSSYGTPHMQ